MAAKKRPRRAHSLEVKLEVLDRVRRGERNVEIQRAMGLAGSTIRSIQRYRTSILRRAASEKDAPPKPPPPVVKPVDAHDAMEIALSRWVRQKNESGVSLTRAQVTAKARKMYKKLTRREKNAVRFTSNDGWLERFKARHDFLMKNDEGDGDCDQMLENPEYDPETTDEEVLKSDPKVDPEDEMEEDEEDEEEEETKPMHLAGLTGLTGRGQGETRLPPTDTLDHFGRYVGSLMRGLALDRSLRLQRKIVSLIVKAHSSQEADDGE